MEMLNTLNGEVAAEMARTDGYVRMRVSGTSMVPAIHPGDFLLVERTCAESVSTGEIVVFVCAGRLVAHRLVATLDSPRERRLVTRGDRVRRNDMVIYSSQLVGRVTSIERGRKRTRPGLRLGPVERVISRLLRFSDRATRLYLRLVAPSRKLFE